MRCEVVRFWVRFNKSHHPGLLSKDHPDPFDKLRVMVREIEP